MLDLAFVRDNLPLVEEKLRQRGMDPAEVLGPFKALDEERRTSITIFEDAKKRRNELSRQIGALKQKEKTQGLSPEEQKGMAEITSEAAHLKSIIEQSETRVQDEREKFLTILKGIPNLPHVSVPIGTTTDENVEVRRWGDPPKFDFTPKPHWELGEQLGVLDLERAAKLSGTRFAVYWDLGARLERALANFMLDLHTREHGYTEVLPPYMVNSDSMYGTGQLPKFAADLFRVPHGDKELWLVISAPPETVDRIAATVVAQSAKEAE